MEEQKDILIKKIIAHKTFFPTKHSDIIEELNDELCVLINEIATYKRFGHK